MTPYYDRDGITIYQGDCADVFPLIDPSTVALLLTDPPYGIGFDTNLSRFSGKDDYPEIHGDAEPFDPAVWLTFPQLALFGANYYSNQLPNGRWIVWNKRDRMEHSPLMSDCELIWHNCKARPVEMFNWYWNGAYRTGEMGSHIHPTQKPVALMRWLVERWTEPGDLVFDPYMGSGPVAQACHDLKRRYIGVEIVEDYCKAAVNRLAQGVLAL